jgi:mono/diheme cytochrome c family protein
MFKQIKLPQFFAISALLVVAVIVLAACASQAAADNAAAQAIVPTVAAPAASATSVAAPTKATNTGSVVTPTNSTSDASVPAAPASGAVSFAKDIAPLLQDSCVSCHGGEKTSKGLDLKTYASLMAGSQNGAVMNPGDAANSLMVQKIQSGSMPKRGTKWTADQLQLLVNWINAGAQNN